MTLGTCISEMSRVRLQDEMEIQAATLAVCSYPDSCDWFSVPDPQVRSVVRSEEWEPPHRRVDSSCFRLDRNITTQGDAFWVFPRTHVYQTC